MLTIEKVEEGNKTILNLDGKLDTVTAPDLAAKVAELGSDIPELVFDFSKLTFLSSAGLRVLLQTHQDMEEAGKKLVVRNVDELIMDILDITGFTDILTIE